MLFVSSCSCLCAIYWSQELSRCSNYIWVINNFIAYKGATYIITWVSEKYRISEYGKQSVSLPWRHAKLTSSYSPWQWRSTCQVRSKWALQWRHNERDCVSNHRCVACSGADQMTHQSSASLAFVRGIYWWPVNVPHKRPVTRKMFRFDDVIMGNNVKYQEDVTVLILCDRNPLVIGGLPSQRTSNAELDASFVVSLNQLSPGRSCDVTVLTKTYSPQTRAAHNGTCFLKNHAPPHSNNSRT